MRNGFLLFLAAVVPVLMAALCDSSGPTTPAPYDTNSTLVVGNYIISGTNIITKPTVPRVHCNGTLLVPDTSSDTMPYTLSGNTFHWITGTNSLASAAQYEMFLIFTRQGSGNGLIGTWLFTNYSYRVVSGTPTAAEITNLDTMFLQATTTVKDLGLGAIAFSGSTMTVYRSSTYCAMNSFARSYSDSVMYNITLTQTSCFAVRLTGNVSGEVVTVTKNSAEDMTYTSTVAAHTAFTYYSKPTTCPNYYPPDWYNSFKSANPRTGGVPKAAAAILAPPTSLLKSLRL